MIDISTIKSSNSKRLGRFWLLVVDEATNMKWSYFLKSKDGQVSVMMGLLKTLQSNGKQVKYIRCDNAGENIALKNRIDDDGLNIEFEFTARETPQQNGKVERAFATLYGRMRAMMLNAKWSQDMKQKHWIEAASTATKLDNMMNEKGSECPYQKFYGKNPLYENHLRTFGEKGIVTLHPGKTIKAKLDDRGIECIFVGYATNHAGNVYRMLNPRTNKVLITRDVRWLKTASSTLEKGSSTQPEGTEPIYLDTNEDIGPINIQNEIVEEEDIHPNAAEDEEQGIHRPQ